MIEGIKLTMTVLQRAKLCTMLNESRSGENTRDEARTRAGLRNKLGFVEADESLYFLTFSAGMFGPDPVQRVNEAVCKNKDRSVPGGTEFELEQAEARALKTIWTAALTNDRDLFWWDPVQLQLEKIR